MKCLIDWQLCDEAEVLKSNCLSLANSAVFMSLVQQVQAPRDILLYFFFKNVLIGYYIFWIFEGIYFADQM